MTNSHKWQKDDRFRIGPLEGTVTGIGGALSLYVKVTLDGHSVPNSFDLDYFNKYAEYVRPSSQEVFDALPIGAYFTADGDGWVRVKTGPDRYAPASQELDFSYNLGRVPIEEVKR